MEMKSLNIMGRVLYFIHSYKNPNQVLRLVKTLRSGSLESVVLIHHDYSKSYLDPAAFERTSGVHIMKTHTVEWGDNSMNDMWLKGFEWLKENSIDFAWFVNLSGQDYPVRPLSDLEDFLKNTSYDGFMAHGEARDVSLWGADRNEDRTHFCYYKLPHFPYYYKFPSILKKWMSILRTSINKVQPFIRIKPYPHRLKTRLGLRRISTPFTPIFKCYRGPTWWTLSHECIKYILESVKNNPYLLRYYQRSLIPEESFFHSIVLNNHAMKIANRKLHYVMWRSSASAHPNVLISEDLDRIVTSKQFFARKFDMNVDSNVIDMIDEHVLKLI